MAAGAPRPALRALRREPLIVDDRGLDRHLAAGARGEGAAPGADPAGGAHHPTLTPELARWARAWLVCWHAALVADPRYGRDDPWTIDLALDAVPVPGGVGDPARREAVHAALLGSGVIELDGPAAAPTARLARALFVEHRAALALDWPAVVAGCDLEPAALLVVRALAEQVVPPDAPAAVPRRDLVARTGYQQKQVRVALRRLAAAGLIAAEGEAGETARYHFTPRALGRGWAAEPATVTPTRSAPVPPAPASPIAPTAGSPAPVAPAAADGGGVRVMVGGVALTVAAGAAFTVAAGLAAVLELGADGRPQLRVEPAPGTER